MRADKQARGLPLLEEERVEHDPRGPDTTVARKAIAAHSRRLALDPTTEPGAKRTAPLLAAPPARAADDWRITQKTVYRVHPGRRAWRHYTADRW